MKKFEYFLVGVFAALGALFLELILDALFFEITIINLEIYLLIAFVIIEELAKLIVIFKKVNLFTPWKDVLQNCFWIGLGFGILELGILFINEKIDYIGNMPAIIAVILVHIVTTILTGLALAKIKNNNRPAILALIPALLLHLAFNYWVLTF